MKILIVDDQPGMARVTAIACRALGCSPFTAGSIAEANRVLAREKIDALFLDVNLAGESGLEYLAQILARPTPPPVIMFSALSRDEIVDEAIQRGALGCLLKPFTLEDLRHQMAQIERYLQQRAKQPPPP